MLNATLTLVTTKTDLLKIGGMQKYVIQYKNISRFHEE